MKFKRKAFKAMRYTVSAVLLLTAVFCVCRRLPEVFSNRDTALAAAAFTLTDGKYYAESGILPENTQPAAETAEEEPTAVAAAVDYTPPEKDKSGYYDSFADHSGEAVYDIEEKTIAPMGVQVDGCYVRNYTDLSPDFNSVLTEKLPFAVDKASKEPQVLIYHTHTGEGYLDADVDYFYESYYSRTNNNGFNVVAVGDAITAGLEKNGIKTVHDTTVHDSSYNGSYERSAQTVLDDMEKYPGLKVVLDIHRDALGSEEQKVKTVFEHDGKKGAQIMILSGCDPDNDRGFENWQNNLNLALKIQNTAEKLYPGMTRPLDFGYFAYNEYICDGSLLIEIGTDANSIGEAEYTGSLLANVLAEVLS